MSTSTNASTRTTTMRRSALPLAVGLLVVLLAGCQSSDKVVVDSVDSSSWIKCALGQSYVNELSDSDPAQYGAATEAWKDYYCANEDTGSLWWSRLEVYGRKYNNGNLCDTSSVAATTTARSVSVQASQVCASGGSSHIQVVGVHRAARSGSSTLRTVTSSTPEVTTR